MLHSKKNNLLLRWTFWKNMEVAIRTLTLMWKLLTIIIHICVSPSGKPEIRDVNVFCHSDMLGIALLGTKIPWSNEDVAFHISWKCSLIIRWRINCGTETPTPCVLLYFKSEYWACSGPMSYNNRNYILIVFNETKWYKNSLIWSCVEHTSEMSFKNVAKLVVRRKLIGLIE